MRWTHGEALIGTLELQDTQIILLGKEAALVWGTFRVVNPDGKQRGGPFTLVMRKFTEGWLAHRLRSHNL
jgi:hypothetical protein